MYFGYENTLLEQDSEKKQDKQEEASGSSWMSWQTNLWDTVKKTGSQVVDVVSK
jgi:hypothetical protein